MRILGRSSAHFATSIAIFTFLAFKSPSIGHLKRRIVRRMTKLLDQALRVARSLPPEAQDDIARVVLQLAGSDDAAPVALSSNERAAIAASKDAAARGEFATDEQVRAVWAKHGL